MEGVDPKLLEVDSGDPCARRAVHASLGSKSKALGVRRLRKAAGVSMLAAAGLVSFAVGYSDRVLVGSIQSVSRQSLPCSLHQIALQSSDGALSKVTTLQAHLTTATSTGRQF